MSPVSWIAMCVQLVEWLSGERWKSVTGNSPGFFTNFASRFKPVKKSNIFTGVSQLAGQ